MPFFPKTCRRPGQWPKLVMVNSLYFTQIAVSQPAGRYLCFGWTIIASGYRGCTPLRRQKFQRESVSLRDCFDLHDAFCLYSNYTKVIGSPSNNDGNGYENVTTKVNSRYLKFYHAYSKWQMTFEVKFQRTVSKFRKRKRKLLSCVPVLDKREIRPFHVVLMQRPLRNVQRA